MKTLASIALALSLLLPTAASAAPRKPHAPKVEATEVQAAKLELAKARAASKLAAHRVKLARAKAAAAKASLRLAREQWIADCIAERTGPTGGVTPEDAIVICTDEAPEGK